MSATDAAMGPGYRCHDRTTDPSRPTDGDAVDPGPPAPVAGRSTGVGTTPPGRTAPGAAADLPRPANGDTADVGPAAGGAAADLPRLTGGGGSNADQVRAWDGAEGAHWARYAERFEASTAAYDPVLFDAAAIGPGMRVLDVGCGSGATTRAAARRAAPGQVVGVDLSAAMIEVARRHVTPGAVYLRADAQVHPFADAAFDVVVSRTGASFFDDPSDAFANLTRAMRPGARMVLLTWRSFRDNAWARLVLGALTGAVPPEPAPGPGPFGLADPSRTREVLTHAGLTDVRIDAVAAPLVLGPTPDEAVELVTGLFAWLLPADPAPALSRLRALMADHDGPDGVALPSAAWLVTAVRP